MTPLARRRAWSFSTVCSTECWLGRVIIPLSLCGVIVSPAFPGGPITTNAAPSAAKATMGRVELEVISITSFNRFVTYESPKRSISKDLTDVETLRQDVQHRSEGLFAEATDRMRFAAQPAGDYLIFCGVAGHGAAGMWIRFQVSASAKTPALLLTRAPKTR